ncbi:agmatine/peptidylarginine deiminase [Roseateles oligotrophus]|uniref:agmatine deiminase family protein n=1 Tax=Roseateles oligotrophus TaxID=1769250 RepID=UPI0039648116
MRSRRNFLKTPVLLGSSLGLPALLGACGGGGGAGETPSPPPPNPPTTPASLWRMPDEGEPHRATWMAFAAAPAVWGGQAPAVRAALARIAAAIVQVEPLKMLVAPQDLALARGLLDPRIQLIEQDCDDLWLRDSGAVFVKNAQGQLGACDFHFNGWGHKQAHAKDALLAAAMARQTQATPLNGGLVIEGGAIEVDGRGTAIITESCVLNANRNPGLGKAACEAELMRLLGLRKIIWLPGIAGRDITDGHTDFYARFAGPGVVIANNDLDPNSYDHAVTRRHLEILRAATDAEGKPLQIVTLEPPSQVRAPYARQGDFAAGYINFYLAQGTVFVPEFGDVAADTLARQRLAEVFPQRQVVQLNIDAIAAGGGGIHCCTQQEPA